MGCNPLRSRGGKHTALHGAPRTLGILRENDRTVFGDGKLTDLSTDEVELFAKSFPTATFGNLIDILVATGLASSKGEARKLIAGNAISINGQKVTADQAISELSLIKKGKNKFALVR